jgi:hypothetical protein
MSTPSDLWSAKLPNGEVRAGTLEQLGEAFRAGHVGESTLVCAAGSDQWARLVDVLRMTAAGPVPSTPPRAAPKVAPPWATPGPGSAHPPPNGDLWQVRMPAGEIRSGTREQLEEAFRAGHLGADLLALAAGATSWRTLGELLAAPIVPTHPASVAPPAAAPVARTSPPAAAPAAPVIAPPPPAAPAGPWEVRLPDGQVRSGTREQLEEAFRAGHLDPSLLVRAAGTTEWVALRSSMAPPPPAPAEDAQPTPVAPMGATRPEPPAAEPPTPPAAATRAEEDPATPAESSASPAVADPDPASVHAAAQADAPWQVQLTLRQIQAAVEGGVIDDAVLVKVADSEDWVPLGSVRARAD